ncbi:RHS repeat-associated core domain-containing protein [Burkholderia ubonensis]|uniref:RHS repeat-associated core domain-containing protein n=1 Tax=Burkholderia ubonensis TaxID=101571 RepID=UPI002FC950DB
MGSGRFVSEDPIRLAGGINAYQYAPNPIQWFGPLVLGVGSGRHTSGIAKPPLTGATPNSIYTKSNATATLPCKILSTMEASI